MSELNEHQLDLIKSVSFANEFLKITRGLKLESDRADGLPQDLKEHLANAELNAIIADQEIEPEQLVWGLMHIVEILLKFSELSPEDLTEIMDKFIEVVKENPDRFRGAE